MCRGYGNAEEESMAEEEKDPSKISTSSFMSVPANTTVETPAPASARFTWTGGAETIEY